MGCKHSIDAIDTMKRLSAHRDWMDRKTLEAVEDIDTGAELIPHEAVIEELNGLCREIRQ